jgi:hypothetical protein
MRHFLWPNDGSLWRFSLRILKNGISMTNAMTLSTVCGFRVDSRSSIQCTCEVSWADKTNVPSRSTTARLLCGVKERRRVNLPDIMCPGPGASLTLLICTQSPDREGSLCVSLAIRMLTSIVVLKISNLKGGVLDRMSGLLRVRGCNCPDNGEIAYV